MTQEADPFHLGAKRDVPIIAHHVFDDLNHQTTHLYVDGAIAATLTEQQAEQLGRYLLFGDGPEQGIDQEGTEG